MKRLNLLIAICIATITSCSTSPKDDVVDLEKLWNITSYVFVDMTNGEYNYDHVAELRDSIQGIKEFSPLDSLLNIYQEKQSYEWISKDNSPIKLSLKYDGSNRYDYDVIPTFTNQSGKGIKSVEFKVGAKNNDGVDIKQEETHCKWIGDLEDNQTIKEIKVWTVNLKAEVNKQTFYPYDIVVTFKDETKWSESVARQTKADEFMSLYHECANKYSNNH